MADALGLTPVHVNRILRDLRAEKMIQHRQRTLTILDWGRLKVFAEFDAHYLHVEPQLM
ncbi:winged helix-turn-helix domain-containing protein [Methylobacterium sp. WL64]|uniref:helix-turn-helix domain-containing protein n=2 Tax=unclassified Methylobacterium TaxID=2615210 RepID=UPI0011CBE6D3|nr:helix-turn-helix domain-containing protein [Methylobacterium sp. WL64]TXM99321.1 winged helix-turn-helix domain-containing protein [Methylobacterium sp. WL64]